MPPGMTQPEVATPNRNALTQHVAVVVAIVDAVAAAAAATAAACCCTNICIH